MGGQIHCHSVMEKGSTFSFSIPLNHQQLSLPLENNRREISDLLSAKILIVDDDELNLFISSELVKPYVQEVRTASSGKEALAMCREQSFSMVLMDIQMPEMDGYETTYHIRQYKELSYLPIIAMTAHASQEDHDKSLKAGMSDHITKPIDPERLLAVLTKWA